MKKFLFLNIALIFLIGCQANETTENSYFQTYTQSTPTSIDPFYSTDVTTGKIQAKIFNGLFKISTNGDLIPDLIKQYNFSGKKLTVELKSGVLFHDGSELTAQDVKFSLWRIAHSINPTSPRRSFLTEIKKILIIDRYKFELFLTQKSATFLYKLTMPCCYIISQNAYLKKNKIIGTGPFIIEDWQEDEQIKLKKFESYFGKSAKISGITYRIIPEEMTSRFEFQNKTLDYLELSSMYSEKKCIQQKYLIPELNTHYIAINNKKTYLQNKLVRQALNYAIDRQQINKMLFHSSAILATGAVPPKTSGYSTTAKPYTYNPQKAKALLKASGINNKELIFCIKSDHQIKLRAQLIQHYLEQIGFKVKIKEMEWTALKATVYQGKFDLAYFTWFPDYPEPENYLFPLFYSENYGSGGNRSFFNHREVDRLLLKAQKTVDQKERFLLYDEIEQLIIDEAPWIFLWYEGRSILLSDRLVSFPLYPVFNGLKGNEISFK